MSDRPGLVDIAIRLMNCGFNLPHGQANFLGEFELQTETLYGKVLMKFMFIKNCFSSGCDKIK